MRLGYFAPTIDLRRRFSILRLRRAPRGGLAVLAAAVGIVAVAAIPAARAQQAVFTVADVAVDVTAKTAAAARVLALARGHRQAFARLMVRLVPQQRRADVPVLAADDLASLVGSFEVEGEKTSPVRYLARLRFRFKPRATREFLRTVGIPFAVTPSKPLLVLPVFRTAGVYLLWDDPNPWRAAWSALPPGDGLVPMVLPVGNLADVNDISAEQAVLGRANRLDAIARRYGAADVALGLARIGTNWARNATVLEVSLIRFGSVAPDSTFVRSFAAAPGQTDEALLADAAAAVAAQIQEDWKVDNMLRFDQEDELVAVVPLAELADWIAIERRLAAAAFMRASELVALSRREARVRLQFFGDREQLRLALAQQDMSLTGGPAKWVLRLNPTEPALTERGGDVGGVTRGGRR